MTNMSRIESVCTGTTFNGIHYNTELAGRSGVTLYLFPVVGTPQVEIDKAVEEARATHDIVGEPIVQFIEPDVLPPPFVPPPATDTGWLEAVKTIVATKTCRRIDPKTGHLVPEHQRGGMLLDLYSAQLMLQVVEQCNPQNRSKLLGMDLRLAHRLVFEVLSKSK